MESKTIRGAICVIFKENRFILNYEGKRRRTWRCSTKYCKASIHSLPGTTDIIEKEATHNHPDNVKDLQKHILRVKCLERYKANCPRFYSFKRCLSSFYLWSCKLCLHILELFRGDVQNFFEEPSCLVWGKYHWRLEETYTFFRGNYYCFEEFCTSPLKSSKICRHSLQLHR